MYKFYSFNDNNVTAFERYSAWFSKPGVFNDPFEGIYIDGTNTISDNEFIQFCRNNKNNKQLLDLFSIQTNIDSWLETTYLNGWAEKYKNDIHDRNLDILKSLQSRFYCSGVCCFIMDIQSDPIKSNLMWGHYGNGLQGFALEVTANPEDVFEESPIYSVVKYNDTPPIINGAEIMMGMIKDDDSDISYESLELSFQLMNTKHTHWGYENELRFISYKDGNKLIKYREGAIKSLFIGERMPRWQKIALYHIAKGHNINDIFEAYVNKESYAVGIRPFVLP